RHARRAAAAARRGAERRRPPLARAARPPRARGARADRSRRGGRGGAGRAAQATIRSALRAEARRMTAAPTTDDRRWLFGPVPDLLVVCSVLYGCLFLGQAAAGDAMRSLLPLTLLPFLTLP